MTNGDQITVETESAQAHDRTTQAETTSPRTAGGQAPPMMRQYELVERVKRYHPEADETLLNRAYVYAMRAHGTQTRASGDLFFRIRWKWRQFSPT